MNAATRAPRQRGFTSFELLTSLAIGATLAGVLVTFWGAILSARVETSKTYNGETYPAAPSKSAVLDAARLHIALRDLFNGAGGTGTASEFYVFGAPAAAIHGTAETDAANNTTRALTTSGLSVLAATLIQLPPQYRGCLDKLAARLTNANFSTNANAFTLVAVSGTTLRGWVQCEMFTQGTDRFYKVALGVAPGVATHVYRTLYPATLTAGAAAIGATQSLWTPVGNSANHAMTPLNRTNGVPYYTIAFPDPSVPLAAGFTRYIYGFSGLR
jgi:hypothetical protein